MSTDNKLIALCDTYKFQNNIQYIQINSNASDLLVIRYFLNNTHFTVLTEVKKYINIIKKFNNARKLIHINYLIKTSNEHFLMPL